MSDVRITMPDLHGPSDLLNKMALEMTRKMNLPPLPAPYVWDQRITSEKRGDDVVFTITASPKIGWGSEE